MAAAASVLLKMVFTLEEHMLLMCHKYSMRSVMAMTMVIWTATVVEYQLAVMAVRNAQ